VKMTPEIWIAATLCLNIGMAAPDGKGNILADPDCQIILQYADREHSIGHGAMDQPGELERNLLYIARVARMLSQKK